MKTLNVLAALSVFLMSSLAQAANCTNVCNAMDFESNKPKCIASIQNSWFDQEACNLCADLDFDRERFECLDWIRNRNYAKGVVATCKGLSFEKDKKACLEAGGRLLGPGPQGPTAPVAPRSEDDPCSLRAFGRKVDGAISHFNAGNYRILGNTLKNMREALRQCGAYN